MKQSFKIFPNKLMFISENWWRFGMFFFLLLFFQNILVAQITSGKIVFERKTNLFKKFKSDDWKEWLGEENKIKVDVFELYFNDSLSVFKPQESDLKERYSWATSKNTVYQNLKTQTRFTIKDIWGEDVFLQDSLWIRKWKISDNKRNICGYTCRKAIWQVNDSVRIYAWYTESIVTSTGPENFNGLPGAILGLATEDGGVIYFAKNIEVIKPNIGVFQLPIKKKNKIYTSSELRNKLEKEYGKEKWGKAMLKEMFSLW